MPTGYTAPVQDGEISDFPTFAARCARAMGALIELRDEAISDELPEKLPDSSATGYHVQGLARAQARLRELRAMTGTAAKIACAAANAKSEKTRAAGERTKAVEKARYEAMLEKVIAWVPPTSEHVGLKSFMRDQLVESIKFDCDGTFYDRRAVRWMPKTPKEWLREQIASAKHDIAYHSKQMREDDERTAARNRWIADLRANLASLGAPSAPAPGGEGGGRAMTMRFWIAEQVSSRAGRRRRRLAKCLHRHRSEPAARACGERMERLAPDARRWWKTAEIVLYPVGARLPDGRVVR